ncbi:MAG: hypothetical protein AAGH88_14635 [Planctomycetota bacterium]
MTGQSPPNPSKPGRKRRLLKWLALLVLLLIAVPLGLIYYYTRPAQLISQAEAVIAEATGCEVSIGNARVNRKGRLTLENVEVRVPGAGGDFAKLFTADRIDMWGEAWGLIDGSYAPTSVQIDRPVLFLTEAPNDGRFNFELIPPAEGGEDMFSIPQIDVNQGEIRFAQTRGSNRIGTLSVIHINGGLWPDPADRDWYRFKFQEQMPDPGERGLSLTGRFDLDAPALELQLADFSYIDEYRFFLPPEFRRWSSRLAPTGSVERMSITLGPDEKGRLGVGRALVDFSEVGLDLNVLDASDPDQREVAMLLRSIRTRLSDISGRLEISNERFTLTGTGQARQSGLGISPIRYEVTASGALDIEQGLEIMVKSQPFVIKDRYEVLLALLPLTGDAYRRFKPSGEMALDATFEKTAPDAAATWTLGVDLLNAKMTQQMFPLTLREVTGRIEVDPQRAVLKDMMAVTAGGATVRLQGRVTPPNDIAEVALDIQITDLPLDEELAQAMQPGERENLARFFDQASYNALVDKGLITPGDDGSAPKFVMGGRVDIDVPVYRPYGEDGTYSIVPKIDLSGVSVLMRDFAYPATVDRGEVEIGDDYVIIRDLELTGATGGGLALSGRADRDPASGDYLPRIELGETLLPIDGLLLHAVGGEAEVLLSDLGVGGLARVSGDIFQTPEDDDVDMALDIVVTDGRAQPYGGSIAFDRVEGLLHLRGWDIPRMSFTGRYGDTALSIFGQVAWDTRGNTSADLRFDADRVELRRALLEVFPPESELRAQLTELYEQYEPTGLLDAELHWEPTTDDEPDNFIAQLHPSAFAFNYGDGRLSFEEVTGSATVWPEYLQLNELGGSFTDPEREAGGGAVTGRITASGEIGFATEPRIGLAFTGDSSDGRGQTVRLLMPNAVNELVDSVDYAGPLRVDSADLLIDNTGGEGQETAFLGEFLIDGASLTVGGLPLTELTGTLRTDILAPPGDAPPRMQYEMALDKVRVRDRLITNIRGQADNLAEPAVLRTGRVVGSMYQGTVVLEAAADLASAQEGGGVRLLASMHDVQLGPLLKPAEAEDQLEVPAPIQRDLESGLISAMLQLDTGYGPDAERLGRGRIRVRDAGLLAENPLELWTLQALNLNLPDRRGFDQASAEFQLIDDAILLERFSMETRGSEFRVAGIKLLSQAVRISGNGVISYPDLGLNLRMRSQMIGTAEQVPFAGVIRSIRGGLVALEVTGTLEDPQVNTLVLPDTLDAWDDLRTDLKPVQETAP